MRKILSIAIFSGFLFTTQCFAMLSLELTQGVAGAVPIAISPFNTQGQPPQDVTSIIRNDLQNSGRFHVENNSSSIENSVTGQVQALGNDQYQVSFQLRDNLKSAAKSKHAQAETQASVVLNKKFVVPGGQLRPLAHHISDLIYQQIIGVRGVFSTRLAYVLVQKPSVGATRYSLEVADQDGYNPRPLLSSTDPIMSPSWSPNGKKIAYVSFENNHASIYTEEVITGARQLVSEFPGINGAPAWSPDGTKLALVLSKSGSPNIYILDLATKQLTQLTHDFYVNTEPAWSRDGRTIIFTSTRSGGPQIYQMNVASRAVSRLSYDGDYNARASFVPSNNGVVMINRDSGWYNIGILDLDTGKFRTLTSSSKSDSDSPSVAPNGSMVLYDTVYNGRSVLAMVASDGSIQIRLPARDGQAQDPAWSPYLS